MWLTAIRDKSQDTYSITVSDAVTSTLPVIAMIRNDEKSFAELKANFYERMVDYIEIYFPGTNSSGVATEFINLVVSNYYTWNPVDVHSFINYIKLNKPDTSGHKVSPAELIASVMEYESIRAEKFELIKHNEKFQHNDGKFNPKILPLIDDWLKKSDERLKEKNENLNEKIRQSLAEYKLLVQLQGERLEKFNQLEKQIEAGNLTEEIAVELFYEFVNQQHERHEN